MDKQKIIVAVLFVLGISAISFVFSPSENPAEQNAKNYSAALSLGASTLKPHVPGQVLIVVPDSIVPSVPAPAGSMNINSIDYQNEMNAVDSHVETLLASKFNDSDLEIETHVLFDNKGAQLNENRVNRIKKINREQGYSTNSVADSSRLIFTQVKSKTKTTQELLDIVKDDPDIAFSQPNYIYSLPRPNSTETEDTKLMNAETPNMQWNIFNNFSGAGIDADKVWEMGYTGKGVTVAVVDTGVDIDHPDLVGNIWENKRETNCTDGIDNDANGFIDDCHGWDFGDDDNDPNGINFHGTHVAGIIAAEKDEAGVVGVAPDAKIMPLKVFPDDGFAQTIDVVNAIEYAWRNNADIISTSLGREDNCSSLEMKAISEAMQAGVAVFTSSGNGDPNHNLYIPFPNAPAVCPGSFATGATDKVKEVPKYSNYYQDMVDALAPGGSVGEPILSTSVNGGYIGSSGTSMATPHVSGIAALLFQKNPLFTPQDIFTLLCEGADDLGPEGVDSVHGCGFVNAQSVFAVTEGSAPRISNASWTPNPVKASPWLATLQFSVCDPDDNLNGGDIRIWQAGTNTSFLGQNIDWDNAPSAPDCSQPVQYSLTVSFEKTSVGEHCVDLEVGDANGNISNKVEDICLKRESEDTEPVALIPQNQNVVLGDIPGAISVRGIPHPIYSFDAGGTGMTQGICVNGSPVCSFTKPLAPGTAVLTVTDVDKQLRYHANIIVAQPQKNKDFEIQVRTDKKNVSLGDIITYTIEYKNIGSRKSAVRVTNTYNPDHLRILQYPKECTNENFKLTCTIGALDTNNSGTISYRALVM